jgi:hypothetical protein
MPAGARGRAVLFAVDRGWGNQGEKDQQGTTRVLTTYLIAGYGNAGFTVKIYFFAA